MFSFLEHIPEEWYAFSFVSNGETLYFKDAYDAELAGCIAEWGVSGAQLFCTKLIAWRELFHFGGGIIVAVLMYALHRWLGTVVALSVTLVLFAYILIQEFVLHPYTYAQIPSKGILDVAVWSLPLALYWAVHAVRAVRTRRP